MTTKLARKDVWATNLEQKLFIEIVHWGVERENNLPPLGEGQGVWNYYITIPESVVGTELFEKELWLEDKLIKFTESSPERIFHDYLEASFANVFWHGGITFYDKIGQLKGHRCVTLGCDFSHIWDTDIEYYVEYVAGEAFQTAADLKKLYSI